MTIKQFIVLALAEAGVAVASQWSLNAIVTWGRLHVTP
jgi:hypothetical protein